jgi:hypothetical protein
MQRGVGCVRGPVLLLVTAMVAVIPSTKGEGGMGDLALVLPAVAISPAKVVCPEAARMSP